jgi:hypothetical protein
MNVADTLYVLIGYKFDEASAKKVEDHFERVRDLAQGVAKSTQAASGGLKGLTQTAQKAAKATTEVDQNARAASASATSFGASFSGALKSIALATPLLLGAGGAALAKGVFDEYKRGAGEMIQLAAASNTSLESFSSLAHVAKAAGLPVDSLRDGLNDLSEKANDAFDALKEGKVDNEYLKTFKELGIDVKSFVKLKPDERFEQFADAINTISDPGKRSAMVMGLMSDEGTRFNLIFNKGTSEIKKLRAEAVALGSTMGASNAKGLESYNLAMARFDARVSSIVNRLAAEGLPMLTEAMNLFLDAADPKAVREMGDGLIGLLKDAHKFAIPVIKDLILLAKDAKLLVKELGGLGNVLKLVLIGLVALKGPALIVVWSAQASAVATFGRALIGLVYTLGGAGAGLKALAVSLRVAGAAALSATAKMALIAIPLLLIEDYATWGSGGESVIGAIFGSKTQDNISDVHSALTGVGLLLSVIAGLVFGIPLGLFAALATVSVMLYSMRDEIGEFVSNLFGLLGIYTNKLLDTIRDGLRSVFVDLPTAMGEGLNARLRGLAYIGSSGPAPQPASDIAQMGGSSTRTVNTDQQINVNVDARGATDPSAVGAASAGGVQDAARQINTQYDSGVM